MSRAPQGNKETTMALLDPSASSRPASRPVARHAKGQPHPAICFVTGLGLLFAAAYAVHVVFNALV